MTKYLLDTSVLSLLAPGRDPTSDRARAWVLDLGRSVFIPVVAIGEVEAGIAKLRRTGGLQRAGALSEWLHRTLEEFGTRVVPCDVSVAKRVGFLSDHSLSIGRHPGLTTSSSLRPPVSTA